MATALRAGFEEIEPEFAESRAPQEPVGTGRSFPLAPALGEGVNFSASSRPASRVDLLLPICLAAIPAASPLIDSCEFGLRQFRNDIQPAEHYLAGFAIKRNPVTFLDLPSRNFCVTSSFVYS